MFSGKDLGEDQNMTTTKIKLMKPVCPYCNHVEDSPETFLKKDRNDPDTHTCPGCGKLYKIEIFVSYLYTTSKVEED